MNRWSLYLFTFAFWAGAFWLGAFSIPAIMTVPTIGAISTKAAANILIVVLGMFYCRSSIKEIIKENQNVKN